MELFDLYTKDREPTGKKMVRGDRVPALQTRLVQPLGYYGGRKRGGRRHQPVGRGKGNP